MSKRLLLDGHAKAVQAACNVGLHVAQLMIQATLHGRLPCLQPAHGVPRWPLMMLS